MKTVGMILQAHFDRAKEWLCECGERGDWSSPLWRWDGKDWQHHHGYPMGHVTAQHKPPAFDMDAHLTKKK